jgi:hypothetical protein
VIPRKLPAAVSRDVGGLLNKRKIRLSTTESLHLFYVLQEAHWLAKERRPLVKEDRDLVEEVTCVLDELRGASQAIRGVR